MACRLCDSGKELSFPGDSRVQGWTTNSNAPGQNQALTRALVIETNAGGPLAAAAKLQRFPGGVLLRARKWQN